MATSDKEIDAAAAKVTRVLMDFEEYPNWSGLASVVVISRDVNDGKTRIQAEFSAAGFADQVTLDIRKLDESSISWSLVESTQIAELTAKFQISELTEMSSKVIYDLTIRFKNPLMNMMKKNVEVQMIDKLLQRLATRAEQL